MENIEIWKDVPGYEGLYRVSNLGNIISFLQNKKGKIIKGGMSKTGYLHVKYKKKELKIHRLIACTFLGLNLNDINIFVCHVNDIRCDNRVDNLFLGTIQDNIKDMDNKGRRVYNGKPIRIVEQYTKSGHFVMEYETIRYASEMTGIHGGHICRCCNHFKGFKSAGGFIWKFQR